MNGPGTRRPPFLLSRGDERILALIPPTEQAMVRNRNDIADFLSRHKVELIAAVQKMEMGIE